MKREGLLWRLAIALFVLLDYFLFSTGNPSVTFSILGGWFVIPLLLAATVTVMYGVQCARAPNGRRAFACYSAIVVIAIAVLFSLSGAARTHAVHAMEYHVLAFVKDPDTKQIRASDSARTLIREVKKGSYTLQRDSFIPTFRQVDYIVSSGSLGALTLTLEMTWNNVPKVSVLRQTE